MVLAVTTVSHQFGIAHDMRHHVVARFVCETACGLGKTRRHEVPDGTADAALMGINGAPHLVEHAAAVASH